MTAFVIAEIGINHNGKLSKAIKMISEAKKSGANAVKFQSFIPKLVVRKSLGLAQYQVKGSGKIKKMINLLEKYSLSESQQIKLSKACKKNNIEFISSAFDLKSLDFLIKKIKVKTLKIPSGEITNFPHLVKAAKSKKKIILSTGMSTLGEVRSAIKVLLKNGLKRNKLTLLHCNSSYPTETKNLNLKAINILKSKFKTEVGFSDHSKSLISAAAAVTFNAKIIEKHFTLNTNSKGPDHKSSLNPKQFSLMVNNLRETENALGKEKKFITLSEKPNRKFARKSIVAKINIAKGDTFSEKNLTTKRPATGLSPMNWRKIIGKKSKKFFKADDLILL